MFAARFFVSVLAFTGLGVYASPVEQRSADASNVLSVVSNLQSSTSTILPQLNNLVNERKATAETVTPLLAELANALNGATNSLETFGPLRASSADQQNVANAFAPIVSDIAVTLNAVEAVVPGLVGLLGGIAIDIDVALNELLLTLDIVLAGVVHLVAGLLIGVAGLLDGLAFTLSLLTLGL